MQTSSILFFFIKSMFNFLLKQNVTIFIQLLISDIE